jgi:hypothetical protein
MWEGDAAVRASPGTHGEVLGRGGLFSYAGKAWSVAPNSDQMTVGSSMGTGESGEASQAFEFPTQPARCLQGTMTEDQDKTKWGKPAACAELFATIRLRAGFRRRAMTNHR